MVRRLNHPHIYKAHIPRAVVHGAYVIEYVTGITGHDPRITDHGPRGLKRVPILVNISENIKIKKQNKNRRRKRRNVDAGRKASAGAGFRFLGVLQSAYVYYV